MAIGEKAHRAKRIDTRSHNIYGSIMAFSVRNIQVEKKARAYAARHKTTLTGAIDLALDRAAFGDEQLEAIEFEKWWEFLKDLQASYEEAGSNGLTEQDIMGWDENGLPT